MHRSRLYRFEIARKNCETNQEMRRDLALRSLPPKSLTSSISVSSDVERWCMCRDAAAAELGDEAFRLREAEAACWTPRDATVTAAAKCGACDEFECALNDGGRLAGGGTNGS